jgi:hypothetical protein
VQSLIGEKGGTRIASHGESNTFIFVEISLLKIPSYSVANYEVNH